MVKSLADAPQCVRNGIPAHSGRFYGETIKDDANVRRLRAICRMFGLGPTAIAKAAGVSQPYVSRILSENDPIVGNPEFYRRLEGCLGKLIDQRQRQFFRIAPVNVRSVERAAAACQRYHAAIERYGDQRTPNRSSCSGVGSVRLR